MHFYLPKSPPLYIFDTQSSSDLNLESIIDDFCMFISFQFQLKINNFLFKSNTKIQAIRFYICTLSKDFQNHFYKFWIRKQMIHGKKKQKIVKTEKELKQEEELSNKINAKLADFFQIRNKQFTNEDLPKYMEFTGLLMQLCSDIPTIFNFRRQLLERALKLNKQNFLKQGEILVNEIKLVTKLIRQDPKSYTLWSFRQWLVQKIYKLNKGIVNEEKQLCKLLLTKDQKNFHVWNYRNWINSVELNIDEELSFTEDKIKSNPFNFSPYHFRSKYLPLKYGAMLKDESVDDSTKREIAKYGMPKGVFDEELQKIKTAIYLNPNEEAPWIYYRWLLKRVLPVVAKKESMKNNVHTFVLRERVKNFSQSLHFQEQFTTITKQQLSNTWQFYSTGDITLPKPQQSILVQTEGIQRQLVFSVTQQLDEFVQIFRTEQQFIREILQEQVGCRFAWLEVLQLLKNQLFLISNQSQWEAIAAAAIGVFQHLDQQQKTNPYIQQLKSYWVRVSSVNTMTIHEKLLIS